MNYYNIWSFCVAESFSQMSAKCIFPQLYRANNSGMLNIKTILKCQVSSNCHFTYVLCKYIQKSGLYLRRLTGNMKPVVRTCY